MARPWRAPCPPTVRQQTLLASEAHGPDHPGRGGPAGGPGRWFAAGRATSDRQTARALEAQADALREQGDALVRLQEQAGRPVVLDAELRAELARTRPRACPTWAATLQGLRA